MKLSPEKFEDGLRKRNFFPRMSRTADDLPPCFTSDGFTQKIANKIGQFRLSRTSGFGTIHLSTTRFSLAPRELEVLHPIPFALLARHLKTNWQHWSHILGNDRSAIRVGPHADGRVFSMTARANSYDLNYPSGRFLAKVDITTFYKSIYTHSLPWAVDGIRSAKATQGSAKGWADGLDKLLQLSRRKETSGIPIGPGTSAVVGEILLGCIDQDLMAQGATPAYLRFVDDYYCVTNGRDEAENFVQNLRTRLSALRLNIHPIKTEIISLPSPETPRWKRQMRASLGPNPKLINFIDALDEVIESAQHADEDSAMRYLLITLEKHLSATKPRTTSPQLDPIARRLLNMSFAYPVVVGALCRLLPSTTIAGDATVIGHLNDILQEHSSKRRTDAVTWILFYLLKNELEITEVSADAVVASEDCLSLALLAHSDRWNHKVHAFLQKFELSNPQDYDRDEYWLLYYQILSEGQLSITLPEHYRDELELLHSFHLKFIDLDPGMEFNPPPVPTRPNGKPGPLPTQSPYDVSIGDY